MNKTNGPEVASFFYMLITCILRLTKDTRLEEAGSYFTCLAQLGWICLRRLKGVAAASSPASRSRQGNGDPAGLLID